MGADRSETSEFMTAKAISRLLAWSCGFPLFPKSPRGDPEGPRQLCMQWVCTKLKNTKFGIFTAFIVNRSKPALCGAVIMSPFHVVLCKQS